MYTYESEIMHHGIKGMHWGIRRYQSYETTGRRKGGKGGRETGDAARQKFSKVKKERRKWRELSDEEKKAIKKKILIGVGGVAAAAIVGTVAYKVGKSYIRPNVRYQNPDGSFSRVGRKTYDALGDQDVIIRKGTKTHRISIDKNDDIFDNKKYVSLSKSDNRKWKQYVGEAYKRQGKNVYKNTYKSTKDLRLASSEKAGNEFSKLLNDERAGDKVLDDTNWAWEHMGHGHDKNRQEGAGVNFAMQTATGKEIVRRLKEQGYDGVVDVHGTNVGKLPAIIFEPDKNIKLKKSKNTLKYWNTVNSIKNKLHKGGA